MEDRMICQEKQTLRVVMRQSLREFSAKVAASAMLRDHLRKTDLWRNATTIYGFFPLASEPDWLTGAAEDGRVLAFPRSTDEGLRFFTGGTMRVGPHGVSEPEGGDPAPPPDLVLVPGLAFDHRGGRLGRGGGFYDRFLAGFTGPRPCFCGVAFGCQILPNTPREPHDMRVDGIVTERGEIRCSPTGDSTCGIKL